MSKCKETPHPLKDINPDTFLDSIVEVFSYESTEYENIPVEKLLIDFITTMKIMCTEVNKFFYKE